MSDAAVLVVGLGNPGAQYSATRHNAGFHGLDAWCAAAGVCMTQTKFHGLFGSARVGGRSVHLLKPQTFMNLSGKSVQACMAFYHIALEDVLVLHDELDLPLGDIRVKSGGGHGGHNGLRSIIEVTGGQSFGRIRIGIGRPEHGDVVNYVLSAMPQDDLDLYDKSLKIAVEALQLYLQRGLAVSMNHCNGLFRAQKKPPPAAE